MIAWLRGAGCFFFLHFLAPILEVLLSSCRAWGLLLLCFARLVVGAQQQISWYLLLLTIVVLVMVVRNGIAPQHGRDARSQW